ncbi:hypothetical protein GCG54_00005732 [Colletotrichum gloeosporioides]|uniref:Uncharacterized protein n=1 Tax=Colletotrichum gloeosporioides TaxID=474922 RepID=A0A8H4CJU9_COLGL|nr:uncharacterized protein GCG54_00005732 [Colletotrichum gloeosporioides]KAF3804987.1 hypothetical protein GCG54_00005732 [Colletotrichum gloeosporioides]
MADNPSTHQQLHSQYSATVMADNPSTYQQSHSQHSATVMADNPSTYQQSHSQHSFGTKNLSEVIKKKNKTMNRQWRKIKKLEKELEKCSKPRPVQQDANVILLRAEVEKLNRELLLKEEKYTSRQEYVVSYLEKSISNYREQLHKAEEKDLQQTQTVQHLQDQISQLEEGYQGAIQQLQVDISTLQNNNKKLTSQLMEKKASIAKAKSLAKAGKVSDDAILSLWKKMKYSIHNLASTILTECPSWEEIEANIKAPGCLLSILSKRIYGFLQDEDTRSSVVELLIWDMLLREVFKPFSQTLSGVCWGGLEGECFSVMVEGMAGTALKKDAEAKSFFHWKAEGGRMIGDLIGVDKEKLKQVADDHAAIFYLFVSRNGVRNHNGMDRLFKNLCKIIEDALVLHGIFMASKAHFMLDRPHAPSRGRLTRYDADWMEAESWVKEPLDHRSSLKFPISPGLVKYGTADGEHYDQQLRLVKARVACH